MDLSKAKVVGYLGNQPIYEVGPPSVNVPQQQQQPPPEGALTRQQDQPDKDEFCVIHMLNNFIDLIEEGLDPYLDRCQQQIARLNAAQIDTPVMQMWAAKKKQDLLKRLAFGSEAAIQLKALIQAADNIFGED